MPLALNSRNPYWPATWARLAMTRTSAAMIPQPPAQPVLGLNARVAQVNVVPQSGSALFSSLYPIEQNSIGTNARTATAGDCSATAPTTNTSVAAVLEAGGPGGVAMLGVETRRRAPALSPLSTCCSAGWATGSATAIGSPPHSLCPTILAIIVTVVTDPAPRTWPPR